MLARLLAELAHVVALVLVAPTGAAPNASKTTYLTFSHPVGLPGMSLGSGTYIFEIANPESGADVVRVMSRDREIAYFMGFTRPVHRNEVSDESTVSLGEVGAGVTPPITAWWPQGELTGREFAYRNAR